MSLRQSQGIWIWMGIGLLSLWLSLLPMSSHAQEYRDNPLEKATIVVDGKVIFAIGDLGNFTAAQRAEVINQALAQTVRSRDSLEIEVVEDNQQVIIRDRVSQRHLLSVTPTDVIEAATPLKQALLWRDHLEKALEKGQLERTDRYIRQAWLWSLGAIVGAIAVHLGWQFLRNLFYRRWIGWLNRPSVWLYGWRQPLKRLWQLIFFCFPLLLWAIVFFSVTERFPQVRHWRYQLFRGLNEPIFSLGKSSYSAVELLVLLALTFGLWFVVKWLIFLLKSYVLSRIGADRGLQEVVAILTQYILCFLGLIILWQTWGLDVGALAILASVLGVGIGFGLQNIANNFISGLILTLERPIQVGDFVQLGELMGVVQRIGARSTEIRTLDEVSIIVPNSRFLETEVINWNHGNPVSRLRIPVGVAYGSDVKRVRIALLEAARSHPKVLASPRPQVWLQKFGESSLDFELLVWIREPKQQFRCKSDLNYRIAQSLQRYGLEVPFPQRDVYLRSPQIEQLLIKVKDEPDALSETAVSDHSSETEIEDLLDILEERLTDTDIEVLVTQMQEPGGLDIRDRRYRLTVYPNCFIGSEAVDWLAQNHSCSREEAIELGQILMERGFIRHVVEQEPFQDGYFFYQFSSAINLA